MDDGTVQEIKLRGGAYSLVPRAEYMRLVREARSRAVDAVEYARQSIGRNLKRRRMRVALTQAEVAAKAGIRTETLCRIETGRGNPTVRTVKRILAALGVSEGEVPPGTKRASGPPRR